MNIQNVTMDRRNVLRGAVAAAILIPLGSTLASCATGGPSTTAPGGTVSKTNPFGMADKSTVDAVIFDGGYGVDYVEYAAKILEKNHEGSTAKVASSTQISQELQPRFVGGNPPDLIDNSGAGLIGMNTILDQLEDLSDVIDADNLEGDKIRDTLYGGVLEPGTFDGKLAAINYVLTVYGVWYSSSLFEANGWTPPTTWAEATDLGKKAKDAGKYLFVFGKEA
ncbi:MAG: extracellular solute-binding protein, partial [Mycetocola sp.]